MPHPLHAATQVSSHSPTRARLPASQGTGSSNPPTSSSSSATSPGMFCPCARCWRPRACASCCGRPLSSTSPWTRCSGAHGLFACRCHERTDSEPIANALLSRTTSAGVRARSSSHKRIAGGWLGPATAACLPCAGPNCRRSRCFRDAGTDFSFSSTRRTPCGSRECCSYVRGPVSRTALWPPLRNAHSQRGAHRYSRALVWQRTPLLVGLLHAPALPP